MKTTTINSRVQYEKREQVAYITLNRPEVLNAMDRQMHDELALIWDDFEADDTIYVGVLTGAGEKSFSVGQDLKELVERQQAGIARQTSFGSQDKRPRLTERFNRVKPIIAKVQGYAFGGGFELALACDIIVASESASFAMPEARLGLIPGAGGVFRLIRQIPYRAALGFLMTGRTMTAMKALELGLVNDVVSTNELDACTEAWVNDILRCAPLSIRAIKEATSKSAALSIEQAFTEHYVWEEIRKESLDALEGPQAFVERRPPIWQNR